ncbi:MAG: YqeG family HAD IIIA-type phosphatase [Anaerotignum sp.]|nr:YqeG family HAD IIIA-type phosphatase [Anaerotignum sp.]
MMLLERFFPDIYIRSVFEMPLAELKEKGIRALVFDIDNTIAPFDVAEPEESIVELFAMLRRQGFRLCILSNNTKERVHLFNRKLGVLAIHKSGKPGIKKLRRAMEIMGTTPESTALVGDQVFTDMWCGHRAGLTCIMTAPICNRDQLVTKVKRGAERQVMRIYFRKYGK